MANDPRGDYHVGHQTHAGKPVWREAKGGPSMPRHTRPHPGSCSPAFGAGPKQPHYLDLQPFLKEHPGWQVWHQGAAANVPNAGHAGHLPGLAPACCRCVPHAQADEQTAKAALRAPGKKCSDMLWQVHQHLRSCRPHTINPAQAGFEYPLAFSLDTSYFSEPDTLRLLHPVAQSSCRNHLGYAMP